MAEAPTFSDRLKVGLDAQVKFEFYFVGLIFTLLGLSVQSAKFDTNILASSCELFGWIALLSSGLIALFRLKRIPDKHLALAQLEIHESQQRILWAQEGNALDQFEKAKGTLIMSNQSFEAAGLPNLSRIRDEVNNTAKAIGALRDDIYSIERGIRWRAVLQWWLFIVGISLVISARAIGPAKSILHALVGT